jgi:hypothetical protein
MFYGVVSTEFFRFRHKAYALLRRAYEEAKSARFEFAR